MVASETSNLTLVLGGIWSISAGIYLVYALYRALIGDKGGKLPPGPLFHFPILGDSIHLATGNPQIFFFNRFKRYGPVYRTMMLGSRLWVVTDMAALRGPLNDDGAILELPFRSFKALTDKESFLKVPGVHGPWRKIFTTALAPPQLAAMIPRIEQTMKSHLARWAEAGRINIYPGARLLGVDLAVDVIMQVKLPDDVDRAWYKSQVAVFLDGLYGLPIQLPGTALYKAIAARDRLVKAMLPEMVEVHGQFMEKWEAAGRSAQSYSSMVLEAHSAAAAGSPPGTSPPPATSPALSPSIFVAQMVGRASVECAGLEDAAKSVLGMLIASGDTTRAALFNTWALLAMSSRVQDELYEEQKKVVEKHGTGLSYAATCSMPYMDATLKECMRLLPASAGGMRLLTADMRVGDYVIPKGETVWYHAGLLHCLDPALWDGDTSCDVPAHMDWRNNFDDAFRPERWLGGDDAARPRSYSTFGLGMHLCVGMNLVYLEVKLLLAMVLRKYRLRLETPDMLVRCERLFPFLVPAKGTDGVLLEPREMAV